MYLNYIFVNKITFYCIEFLQKEVYFRERR